MYFMRSSKSNRNDASTNFVNNRKTHASSAILPDAAPTNDPAIVPTTNPLLEHEVDFAELDDGTLIETIEDPNDAAKSLFAIYGNEIVRYAAKVKDRDRMLIPIPRKQGIFTHVRLPRGTQPYGSSEDLLTDIVALIVACVDISVNDATLVAAFVLSTWFIERLSVAPYLALVGLPRSGKTTLLQVLNLVCRRSLLTADITSAAFYELYEKLTPTLLVDEVLTTGNKRQLFHLLKTGSTRGSVTFRRGRSLKAFGPKVISCTEFPSDAALSSRCAIISLQETSRTDLVKTTNLSLLENADTLRNALLQYRLENYHSLRLAKVEGDQLLYSRTRDLYEALALPLGNNAGACGLLVHLFKIQQEINRESLSPASAAVLRALYEFIHSRPQDGKCAQRELTVGVNLNLERLRETFRLNAYEVGRALTSLGFTNRKRMNTGFILWLDLETRKRIHNLARAYAIDQESQFQEDGFSSNCDLCKNLGSKSTRTEIKGDS